VTTQRQPEVFASTSYTDADLSFLVQTHYETEQLAWMLGHLRSHFPLARVIVRSDGDSDPLLPALVASQSAEFYLDPELYALARGGEVCHRWLELFFLRPTRYLFKLDPDTGIHRRFHFLPAHPGIFGTLQWNSRLISIQGGCIGLSLAAATQMFKSRAFLDPLLLEPERSWAADPPLQRLVRSRTQVSDDWLVGYVATSLGIPMFGFPEVQSLWKRYMPNPNLRFAITHPCKRMTL